MRISDWSSDVCSSDLGEDIVWSAWRHAAALRGGDGLTHRLEHNDAFLYGAGDAKLGSIIGKGARAGAQLRARFLAKFPALAKLIKAVKAAARSEEHTSELQSLMRISYAVFCLKKKNNTISHNDAL